MGHEEKNSWETGQIHRFSATAIGDLKSHRLCRSVRDREVPCRTVACCVRLNSLIYSISAGRIGAVLLLFFATSLFLASNAFALQATVLIGDTNVESHLDF